MKQLLLQIFRGPHLQKLLKSVNIMSKSWQATKWVIKLDHSLQTRLQVTEYDCDLYHKILFQFKQSRVTPGLG